MGPLISFLVKCIFWFVSKMPMPVQMFFGKCWGWLWFDILRIRRDVALANLEFCFPNKTDKERVTIARNSCHNLGMSLIEFCRFPFVGQKDRALFQIQGVENLEAALAKGNGVMILTQHIGNGDWATVGLSLHGIKLHVITKEMGVKWANDIWFESRRRLGTELIADRNTAYKILKTLKKNGVVAYMLDQFMGPPLGVRTKFFGKETGTPMGLALLTRRSKAAVVPVYTLRRDDGVTIVNFAPEIPFVESENPEDTVADMTQIYCDKIEEYVRKFPNQWMWVHRRWKPFRD